MNRPARTAKAFPYTHVTRLSLVETNRHLLHVLKRYASEAITGKTLASTINLIHDTLWLSRN